MFLWLWGWQGGGGGGGAQGADSAVGFFQDDDEVGPGLQILIATGEPPATCGEHARQGGSSAVDAERSARDIVVERGRDGTNVGGFVRVQDDVGQLVIGS